MPSKRVVGMHALAGVAAVFAFLAARAGGAQGVGTDPAASRPGIERLGAVVQQRLQLTDEQTARLRETSRRYAEQRKDLLRDERDARQTVRAEMGRGNAADQARVQSALDRLYAIQQRRTELAASEQRELAGFLSPTQRAQYAGLQERALRAAQDIRQRRDAAALTGAAPPDANRAAVGATRRPERQPQLEQQQQRQAQRQLRQAERAARRAEHGGARRPR
ncbi:hypothetical protein tb265_38030 [Gemmatimonadetes bacterium T265]|nr:hypothetical protein tb265_38030 [Gemmatimonadetes bacterium T265]